MTRFPHSNSRQKSKKNVLYAFLFLAVVVSIGLLAKKTVPSLDKLPLSLNLSLSIPFRTAAFTHINSVSLYSASDIALDTLLPILKDSRNDASGDMKEVNIKVTLVYSAANAGPFIMPLSIEKFEIAPNFDTLNSYYLRHRPPGYTISILVYSGRTNVKMEDLRSLVIPKVRGVLPIVYNPNKYFKKVPRKEREANDEPRMMVRSERRDRNNVIGNYQAWCRLCLVPFGFPYT